MRLLLIQPTSVLPDGTLRKLEKADRVPGLSLPLVAALTPPGIEIKIIDERYQDIPYDEEWDLVGLTVMTYFAKHACEIAKKFRGRNVPVVMGGSHTHFLPDETSGHCDSIVIGEAEETWSVLLEDLRRGDIKPRYRSSGPCDVTVLPQPRLDLLDGDIYKSAPWPLQTSRGCPNKCDYCCVKSLYGGKYRMIPTENVLRDVRALPSRNVEFVDDNLVGNMKRSEELFQALIPCDLRWTGQVDVRAGRNARLLSIFKESGCHHLSIGMESMNQASLDGVNKRLNRVEEYPECIKALRKEKLEFSLNFMFGFEEDTVEIFEETLRFLIRNRVPSAQFTILTPPINTAMWQALMKDERIIHSNWNQYDGIHLVFRPRRMTTDELETGYWRLHRSFLSFVSILRRARRSSIKDFLADVRSNLARRRLLLKYPEQIYL